MKHTFKRAMSLFMALAMVLTMVPSFGTHVHAEELETEPVVVTEEPATEAPVVEVPVEEVPETEAPTQAPETEAPATEAPTEPATEVPEVVETEAPEVTEEAPEVVETEPAEETEATEETFPEEILEEEIVEEEAVAVSLSGLSDSSIGIDGTESRWTVGTNNINGSVTGTNQSNRYYLATTERLTITNNKSSVATLSFSFSISGFFNGTGYVWIDCDENDGTVGTQYKSECDGTFSKELAPGDSILIKIYTPRTAYPTVNTVNCTITGLSLVAAGNPIVTFIPSEFGGFTVNGNAIESETAMTNPSSMDYVLEANVPEGYKFIGWYNETAGKYISTEANCTIKFDTDATIYPVIVQSDAAVFLVGQGNYFADLGKAAAYAKENNYAQITLVESGKVFEGEYIIPNGITLLIPMDTDYSPMGVYMPTSAQDPNPSMPEATTGYDTPYAFKTLNLDEGAKIVVEGTVETEAKHTALQGAAGARINGGRVSGPYGAIYMNGGSEITVRNGAKLFAWGYVYGSGSVVAESGAKVYEYMQVTDFPGGSNLAGFVDKTPGTDENEDDNPENDYVKSFPMSQYYVQNIEVPLKIYKGAAEYLYATVSAAGMAVGMPVLFIGDNGMFVPTGDHLVKDYVESTDRMVVDIYGDATVTGIALDMGQTMYAAVVKEFMGTDVFDSSRYIFGLNSNITINIHSGKTAVAQDIAMFPGTEIAIDKDAVLHLEAQNLEEGAVNNVTVYGTGGHNVYVYDLDQWGNRVFQNVPLVAASYSPAENRHKRTAKDLKDAVIDINGTMIIDGYLYSTVAVNEEYIPVSGGAAIISSNKTGKVAMNSGAGTEEMAYSLNGTSSVDDIVDIASVWLKNGDGTYLQTAGAEAGTTYNYCAHCDCWYVEGHEDCGKVETYTVKWVVDGTTVKEEEVEEGMKADFGGEAPTKEGHTFIGWDYDEDGKVDEAQPAVTADATYTAVFEINTYTVTWTDAKDTTKWENIEHGKVIDTAETADEKTYDATYHYTFSHWEDAAGNKLTEGTTKVTGDVTFTAVYTETAHSYTTEVEGTKVDATCMAAGSVTKKCACGAEKTEVLPIDKTNHASDKVTYTYNDDTHSATYDCCKAPYVTNEPHTYVDGICACEAVQTFTVTFDGNGKTFYIYADSNYPDTLPVTVTYGTAAETIGFGEVNAENNWVWSINCDGMVLSGWNTKADGTGEHYAIGAEIKPTADMTLYAIWKEVAVGGVGLNSGEYLDLHGNVTTTEPEGGYAYYNDGTLTLNNYSYTGEGYMYQANPDMTAAVYGKLKPLTIVLEGENRLKNTFDDDGSAVYADNLTIEGEGTLTAEAAYAALSAHDAMVIQGGTLNLKAPWAIFSYGTVTVSGGTVTGNGSGYVRGGWTFKNNIKLLKPLGGYVDEYGDLRDADGDLVESFKLARAYTVTFLDKDGEQIGEAQTVEHGKPATAPTAPEVTGYTFTNWDKDFTAVTSDLTVQAVYTVNKYTLTVNVLANGETVELTVPYGANLLKVLKAAAKEGKIPAIGDKIYVNIPNDYIGYKKIVAYSYLNPEDESYPDVDESMTMPADELEIDQTFYTYGWIFTDPDGDGVCGAEYFTEEDKYLTGWQYVEEDFDGVEGGAWYYFETVVINDTEYYYRAEGITRVPYPVDDEGNEIAINGITYGPNEEDLEYAEDNGVEFIDKDTGLFVFGDDGKFQQNHSGISGYEGENRKVTNGLIEWHPGVVDLAQYLYFIGDEEVGGNKLATGDVYVARNSTSRKFVIGGVYTFSESGPLCEYDGITEVNGKLRYYEDAQLMLGKGLTKVGENYIYVRSNGELVVGEQYWVGTNDLGVATGMYDFDENGFMIEPIDATLNGVIDGVYYVNGKPYYAGLIKYNGGIIYVTSSGKLATGKYWVTKTNGMDNYDPGFYFFDEDGYMEQERNGIVPGKDENGNDVLYYYENNQIKYNAGLIEYLIENNKHLIYVRSNGQLAIGTYWITNTNDLKPAGCYEFDENGYMIVGNQSGIYEENGKLYYYIDGIKQFGNGLVKVEGDYIYVKTNGELATGTYWITRTNDLKDAGCYEFSADGYMILG